ncbi:EAL domain-containing protein [Edwardsiella piscicida C07-087]|nr:EAL domain-containing protein [Edwardsiella piscicida C07-087]
MASLLIALLLRSAARLPLARATPTRSVPPPVNRSRLPADTAQLKGALMLFSHITMKRYRLYRALLAITIGALVCIISLASRYQQELTTVQQMQRNAATIAITQLERILSRAETVSKNNIGWVNQRCEEISPHLTNMAIHLETIRAVLLVKDGIVTCSNLINQPIKSLRAIYPEMLSAKDTLVLRAARLLNRGSPILLFWRPDQANPTSGMVYIFNIATLSAFILAPRPPYVDYMALNVAGHTLRFNDMRVRAPTDAAEAETPPRLELRSSRYPFSISLFSPAARDLALQRLPRHIPLALLLFLLASILTYLASANRMSLAYPIAQAIRRRQFTLYCQPIIHTESGRCEGVEILLRWYNPRHGWTSPEIFIPLAEQNGLIVPLTRYLLEALAAQRHHFPHDRDFYFSINVAAEHFAQGKLALDIQNLWLRHRPQQRLMLELTERTRLPSQDYPQLHILREMGLSLALDDFGTGHSSLSYLQDLQPEMLKIDRAFCATIGSDAINARVLDLMIDLARQLRLRLVMEGVEQTQQADYLRQRQVYSMQGYLFARPMPLRDFPGWHAHYQRQCGDSTPAAQSAGEFSRAPAQT